MIRFPWGSFGSLHLCSYTSLSRYVPAFCPDHENVTFYSASHCYSQIFTILTSWRDYNRNLHNITAAITPVWFMLVQGDLVGNGSQVNNLQRQGPKAFRIDIKRQKWKNEFISRFLQDPYYRVSVGNLPLTPGGFVLGLFFCLMNFLLQNHWYTINNELTRKHTNSGLACRSLINKLKGGIKININREKSLLGTFTKKTSSSKPSVTKPEVKTENAHHEKWREANWKHPHRANKPNMGKTHQHQTKRKHKL